MGRTVHYRTSYQFTEDELVTLREIVKQAQAEDWCCENFKLWPCEADGSAAFNIVEFKKSRGVWGFTKTRTCEEDVSKVFKYLRKIEDTIPGVEWDVHDEGGRLYKGPGKLTKFAKGRFRK